MIDKNRIAVRVVQHETHTKDSIMGSLRCLLAESGTIHSQAAARPESGVSTESWGWTKAVARQTSLCRDRICPSNRHSMEGIAQGTVWEFECDPSVFFRMAGGGIVRTPMASRADGV